MLIDWALAAVLANPLDANRSQKPFKPMPCGSYERLVTARAHVWFGLYPRVHTLTAG